MRNVALVAGLVATVATSPRRFFIAPAPAQGVGLTLDVAHPHAERRFRVVVDADLARVGRKGPAANIMIRVTGSASWMDAPSSTSTMLHVDLAGTAIDVPILSAQGADFELPFAFDGRTCPAKEPCTAVLAVQFGSSPPQGRVDVEWNVEVTAAGTPGRGDRGPNDGSSLSLEMMP